MDAAIGVVNHLHNIKEKLGEDAWKAEIRRLAKDAFKLGGKHEIFWRGIVKDFEWLDVEALVAEAKAEPAGPPPDPTRLIVDAMRSTMPALRTQAQFNAFMASFDALRLLMNYVFEGNAEKVMESKRALEMSIDAAAKVTQISEQLRDVPEAATSHAAEEFKNPPAEFHEYDLQKQLMSELEAITGHARLVQWYETTVKSQESRIKSQTLRNALFDAIRTKKTLLQSTTS